MMDIETLRKKYRSQILASACKHHLKDIRIFGSFARGEATEDSDIDFVVDLDEGGDLIQLGAFYMDMENLLQCKVDIVTPDRIHHHIRNTILQEATLL